jgi:hypothetical protein
MSTKAEQVARMMGKSTYKDFRQGFAQTMSLDADSDSDIKGALGIAQRMTGVTAIYALETLYGATLDHERHLRRAWDALQVDPKREAGYAIRRLGCSLAIREHAGIRVGQSEKKEWAWMLRTNYEVIEDAIRKSGAWLDDITGRAERAFMNAIKESREEITESLKSA